MYHIHQIIKRYFLSHLTLYGLVILSTTLHAATPIGKFDAQKSYHYTSLNFTQEVYITPKNAYLYIAEMPKDIAKILNTMHLPTQPHIYFPQLLTMVAYDHTSQDYRKYLFASNGFLKGRLAQQTARQLNYHLVVSSPSPVLRQMASFLAHQPNLVVQQGILASLLNHNLPYVPQPKISPTASTQSAFYNPPFSLQQNQITTIPLGIATKASAKDTPHYHHYQLKYTLPTSITAAPLPKPQPPIPYVIGLNQSYSVEWFTAAKAGDRHLLSTLYNNYNIHIDHRNEESYTALLFSAQNGHLDCLKYLLQQGANIHAKDKFKNTSLLLSARAGHLGCLKYLCQQGANIDAKNKKKDTSLLLSAQEEHLDCLKYLLQQGANINAKNTHGYTALLFSAEKGHLAYIKHLVEQGADINTKNKWHNTPLILSAYKGHLPCVKYLCQRGADIHKKNNNGYTALLMSTENGYLYCLKYLHQQGADIHHKNKWHNTPLLLSAYKGHPDHIKYLLQQSADINARNRWGSTSLLLSAYKKHLVCLRYLASKGADMNIADKDGNTAMLWSASKGHLNCLKFLLQQGTDIHARNKWHNTPLLLSAENGHLICVKYLLQQGANIYTRNQWGSTALLLSAYKGHLGTIKYLIQQDANIHDKNNTGHTALLWSACKGHLLCIKYLCQQGANIHDKNNNGYTPLLYCAINGHPHCLKYLLQQGANIHDKNNTGDTALTLSAQQGHIDCVQFLLTSVDLCHLHLQGVNFSQVTLPKDLVGVNFTDTILPKDLTDCDLTHANLTGQRFTATNFEGTQLQGVILTNTSCNYQKCFQDQVKALQFSGSQWYLNNLPKDLKSIAQVYPHLSQHTYKAALLQIASGLAYLPYWEDTEFYIKVYYWSCKLLLLKKQLNNKWGAQLVCTLANDLTDQANAHCWQTSYPQHHVEETTKAPHNHFDQYLNTFQSKLQEYNCHSNASGGDHWYKDNIEKNIQGLKNTYPKLTNPKHRQEAVQIAFQLSTLYQYQHFSFLVRYLFLQNRLIKLKLSAGVAIANEIHYDKYQ